MIRYDAPKFLRAGLAVFAFLLAIAVLPLTPNPAGDAKVLLIQWAGLILGGAWLAAAGYGKVSVRVPKVFGPLLALFLLLNLAACFHSEYPGNSFSQVSKLISLCILFFLAAQAYEKPEQVRVLMLSVCMAAALSSLYALCRKAGFDPLPWTAAWFKPDSFAIPAGSFGAPDTAAYTIVLGVVLSVGLAVAWRWWACLLLTAIMLAHGGFVLHRGGLVALAASVVLVAVAWGIRGRGVAAGRPVRSVAVSIATAGLVTALGVAGLLGIMKSVTPPDEALAARSGAYASAAKMIGQRPLLGWGPGNYRIANVSLWTPAEQQWYAKTGAPNAHVHNDILECGVDAGILGTLIYGALLVLGIGLGLSMTYAQGRNRQAIGWMYAAFFCAFAVGGLFGFYLRAPVSAALFFLLLGTLEGTRTSAPERDTRPLEKASAIRWACVGVAGLAVLANGAFGTRVFMGQVMLRKGIAAISAPEANMAAYQAADAILRTGGRTTPWDWMFGYCRGLAWSNAAQWEPAAQSFEDALSKNPYHIPSMVSAARASVNLASLKVDSASTDDQSLLTPALEAAERNARRAHELCAPLPEPENMLGRVAFLRATQPAIPEDQRSTLLTQAEDHFLAALNLGPANPAELWRTVADVRGKRANPDGEEEALVRAVQSDIRDNETWSVFLKFAKERNRFTSLRNELAARVQRLNETGRAGMDEPGALAMAMAYVWQGQVEAAERHDLAKAEERFGDAVRVAPMEPAIWSYYAGFALANQRVERLKTALVDAYAQAQADGKPIPLGVEAVALVRRRGPGMLAEATARLGAASTSISAARATLELEWVADLLADEAAKAPETTESIGKIYGNLTAFYASLGIMDKGKAACDKALLLLPSNDDKAACLLYYAAALTRRHRDLDAEALLRSQIPLVNSNPVLSEFFARVLGRNGKKAEARFAYTLIMQLFPMDSETELRVKQAIADLDK